MSREQENERGWIVFVGVVFLFFFLMAIVSDWSIQRLKTENEVLKAQLKETPNDRTRMP